jgi:Na+-translocating ferredoxin:NAD+ oxidoreductase RnfD subunit
MRTPHPWSDANRLAGLRRFAVAITTLNVLGHTVLGFEQSWAHPLVALAATYGTELLLEIVDARASHRRPRFAGGGRSLVDFLLSAHITGLAVAMLLYANEHLWPVAFAGVVAIASKSIIRVAINGSSRHVLNPSNFGITTTLLLFPWVGIAPPYQFTENVSGFGDWLIPGIIVVSGSFLNARFTRRLPLVISWLTTFAAQAVARSAIFDTPVTAALLPMTGLAFLLYTFYMVTDPATTPARPAAQIAFGAAVAIVYAQLMLLHVVFGLFFALTIVCVGRGLALYARSVAAERAVSRVDVPSAIAVGRAEP